MTEIHHTPVLLDEVLEYLQVETNEQFIDGTVGQGGHAAAIMQTARPGARLLGIDRDPRNLEVAKERLKEFGDRVVLVQDTYANLKQLAHEHSFNKVDGILLDLGFSSAHIEEAERGFSFQREGPLDMRYDPQSPLTAREIVNSWNEDGLARIFRRYGEEKKARPIAQAIITRRQDKPFETTTELAECVSDAVGRRGKIHPATKVFQALRIAVNDELGELERVLPEAVDVLEPGGRLAVISFHSGEDRIVKRFMQKRESSGALNILTKNIVQASREEVEENPRARSAKLRVAEKV
jgi:16S rRNA (cytosine1402-N4)-methyltransferase